MNTAFLAEQDILNRLEDIQTKFIEKQEKPKAKIVSLRNWIVTAAAILVGLVIGIYLLKPSTIKKRGNQNWKN